METSDGERCKASRPPRTLTWSVSTTCISREEVARIVKRLRQAIVTSALLDLDRMEDAGDAAEDDEGP